MTAKVKKIISKAFIFFNPAGVVSERKLVKVSLHVFPAKIVVSSYDSSFAVVTPESLNGVCINPTISNVNTMSVVNNSIPIYFLNGLIPNLLVHIEHYISFYVSKYRSCKLFVRYIPNDFANDSAATFKHT
ncbi:Uncharacterised protein [Prevotella intermedia]|nr:Uncharacterised protein [Prevotella intermedia]